MLPTVTRNKTGPSFSGIRDSGKKEKKNYQNSERTFQLNMIVEIAVSPFNHIDEKTEATRFLNHIHQIMLQNNGIHMVSTFGLRTSLPAPSCLTHCTPRNKGESSAKANAAPVVWQCVEPSSGPWPEQAYPNFIASIANFLKLSINWTFNTPKESSSNPIVSSTQSAHSLTPPPSTLQS